MGQPEVMEPVVVLVFMELVANFKKLLKVVVMKKFSLQLFGISLLLGVSAHAVVSPSEVLISVYAISVSTSADCSNPTVVLNNGSTPVEYNFTSGPKLGAAAVTAGTYPCIIMKMSDVIKFRPATTEGTCTAGTQYTIDVCRAGSGTYTPMTISGSSATYGTAATACTGSDGTPVDTQVPLFLSTQSTNSGGGGGSAFDRPAVAGTNGFTLNGAFVVTGTGSGTFVVNFNNKVDGSGGSCGLNPPVFGFR